MGNKNQKGLYRGLTNYGDSGFSRYLRRSFASSMGYSREELDRPIIGIADSGSGFNSCHRHFPELIEAVTRGVLSAGALPIVFPTISLSEPFIYPTTMMFRNLMSMDVEEMIRAQPMDAVVLVGGCDKTVPAQLMGAISAERPAIHLVAGPMLTGNYQGERLGACTDCRRHWSDYRGGIHTAKAIEEIEGRLVTTAGTCAVMGTASTMACILEALGMLVPGSSSIPAVHSDRLRAAEVTGRLAVQLALSGLTPKSIINENSLHNALCVLLAIGGSTNALIHLNAIAGRLGYQIDANYLNELAQKTPVLVNLKPSGTEYMEDFHAAGGLPAVLRKIRGLLYEDCLTVTGRTLGEEIDASPDYSNPKVIKDLDNPIHKTGGLATLFGSLAPNGALIKYSAAAPELLEHTGKAVVFDSLEDMANRIDSPELDVSPEDVLVLRNAGPKAAGMPESGYIPIPEKLARKGVRDMVRISDARMSGTAYGTVVLHVSPEASVGGPLALVQDGDLIKLSVSEYRIDLLVDEKELAQRKENIKAKLPRDTSKRGYTWLYEQYVMQAEAGCDFEFLTQNRTANCEGNKFT